MSIIAKFQKCGKENCKCVQKGELHGPYLWYVKYQGRLNGKPKYYWKYLGITITEAAETLEKEKLIQIKMGALEKTLEESFSEIDLKEYIKMAKKKRKTISIKILDEMALREEKR